MVLVAVLLQPLLLISKFLTKEIKAANKFGIWIVAASDRNRFLWRESEILGRKI